jgi:hypothetical protein
MKRANGALAALLCVAGIVAPAAAHAQPTKDAQAQAQVLFDEGLALMKAGKYAEACPKLQQSQKLDPGMGTQYRLAECYESAGLIGSAWQLFTDVATAAKSAGRADRETQARQRADAIQKRVPMMTLVVPPAVASLPGLAVRRDGEDVAAATFNRKAPVDPGAHTVVVSATGKKAWETTVRALEGGAIDVTVPALENADGTKPPEATKAPDVTKDAPQPDAPTGFGAQRIAGVVVGAVGLVGVGVGSAFGAMAKSKWNETLTHCKGGDPTKCDAQGIKLGGDASRSATIATAGFIAGGACVATGLVVLLTAPSRKAKAPALRVTPVVGREGALGMMEGSF